ncbi:type IV toxin-antitoxin system AbiEi family antitoxin domain-containing protein [Pseudonocardia sp. KRD-184]|uniref:Type IV toxin-antitoxin system AbiEi family antitoxin domain-containing protein n=1 Tax=Pseudonocardia oceani TaxID=2792013 RepID=A0ABS6UE04_9PSEU|nr:type IV toxin-antitoxin system AbiEi family antitoxin domain-containing protein [Pseudonocardia oceani]MBW0088200.1 type IV toxin-antitoxin system AbiEi family antitoxin domain-containing protein [Pseudonocardia oceani]MBW0094839.1 type IV toxin-antitoxin system AbiEi family antitoxin domain-containing protein [Pseudonocardia oceani]MBW0107617.1 type IV toxin-antitoxin system AbiEi family antitoxin domain-containing protein [Pseudonocardia oceani]MBW0121000.1 type IV toxin-antitoxin system A
MLLDHLLARQAGVLTTVQAVECGISARTVRRRVQQGEWEVLHPGVLLVGGHRHSDEARVRAAWLWAGTSAMVSGPAAAYWHRMLDRAPAVVEVTVPRNRHLRPQPGVVLHRRDLSPADHVAHRHLSLTAEPLTALETAVVQPGGSVFLDRALQRHVRFPTLYRAYCRNLGRRGSPRATELIAASADRADSAAERLLVTLLRNAGVTGWVLGHPFGSWRIDLAFPSAKLAIEVDGWAWHVDAERFRNDRRKGNAITRAGWDLLRYTWHALDGEPAATVAEIAGTVAAAA